MTWHAAAYLIGWSSLGCIFTISAFIFADAARQWRRIWSTALGRHLPPAASVALPHRPRRPLLRAVEAGAERTPELQL